MNHCNKTKRDHGNLKYPSDHRFRLLDQITYTKTKNFKLDLSKLSNVYYLNKNSDKRIQLDYVNRQFKYKSLIIVIKLILIKNININ